MELNSHRTTVIDTISGMGEVAAVHVVSGVRAATNSGMIPTHIFG